MDAVTRQEGVLAPWDIVRVDFPFAATPAATDIFSIVWVLMITSAAQKRRPLDVPISGLRLGGLTHACVIRSSKVTALDARLAVRIGELGATDRAKVAACLRELLGTVLTG